MVWEQSRYLVPLRPSEVLNRGLKLCGVLNYPKVFLTPGVEISIWGISRKELGPLFDSVLGEIVATITHFKFMYLFVH